MTKMNVGGMTVEVVNGVLTITGLSIPVSVNGVKVFSLESSSMKEELSNFLKAHITSTETFFSELAYESEYQADLRVDGLDFKAFVPSDSVRERVQFVFKDIVHPERIFDYLDTLPTYTDNNRKIETEENKFFEAFKEIILLTSKGTSSSNFRFGSSGFSLKESTKADLVYHFNASKDDLISVEDVKKVISAVKDYVKFSVELLDSY